MNALFDALMAIAAALGLQLKRLYEWWQEEPAEERAPTTSSVTNSDALTTDPDLIEEMLEAQEARERERIDIFGELSKGLDHPTSGHGGSGGGGHGGGGGTDGGSGDHDAGHGRNNDDDDDDDDWD